MTDTTTNPHATLARIVSTFTLGAIGDRVDIRKKAADEALELTEGLEDTAPEKMLAYALDYGADQAAKRQDLERELDEAKDAALRLRTHELTSTLADARKRLLPLLEDHDRPSDELGGLLQTLRRELDGLSETLHDDFYVELPEEL